MIDSTHKYSSKKLPDPGENVRLWRKSLSLKQADVAAKAGLSHNALSRIERGVVAPRENTLKRIAAALGISFHELMLKSPGHGIGDERAQYDTGVLVERLDALPVPKRTAVVAAFYSLLEQIESDDD